MVLFLNDSESICKKNFKQNNLFSSSSFLFHLVNVLSKKKKKVIKF